MAGYGALHFELGIRGLQALQANFYALDDAAREEFLAGVVRFAEETHDLAYFLCPVDTGFMREHITTWFTQAGYGFEVGWAAADFFEAGLAFYPFFQEFGTVHHGPQPSVGPAWEETAPAFEAWIRDTLRRLTS